MSNLLSITTTGKARCPTCKKVVPDGEPRFLQSSGFTEFLLAPLARHFHCVAGKLVGGFIADPDSLSSVKGYDNLSEEQQGQVKAGIERAAAPKTKSKATKKKEPKAPSKVAGERKKQEPSKRKKGGEGGPKRPLSAYMLFSADARAQFVANNPDATPPEIMKGLGALWKEADDETKKKFTDLAVAAKELYASQVQEFEKTGKFTLTDDQKQAERQAEAKKKEQAEKKSKAAAVKRADKSATKPEKAPASEKKEESSSSSSSSSSSDEGDEPSAKTAKTASGDEEAEEVPEEEVPEEAEAPEEAEE